MCTSVNAKRTGTVAVCRALRERITRFEDAFIQLHGRPPKGASEKAPLGKTYAQYRDWKRAIRADAACRIQALVRGAITRQLWRRRRRNNPEVLITVTTSPARSGFGVDVRNNSARGQASVLDEIRNPSESGHRRQKEVLSQAAEEALQAWIAKYKEQTRISQWSGSNESKSESSISISSTTSNSTTSPITISSTTSAIQLPAASSVASSTDETFGDLACFSLPELQACKRLLKRQLVKYDDVFTMRNGRMPNKAEKEPIRHLYERYNALKGQIDHKTVLSSSSNY